MDGSPLGMSVVGTDDPWPQIDISAQKKSFCNATMDSVENDVHSKTNDLALAMTKARVVNKKNVKTIYSDNDISTPERNPSESITFLTTPKPNNNAPAQSTPVKAKTKRHHANEKQLWHTEPLLGLQKVVARSKAMERVYFMASTMSSPKQRSVACLSKKQCDNYIEVMIKESI